MEYLVVHFPRSRRVLIDDEFNGRTNELIELEAGRHTVSLGPPYHNFIPDQYTIVLKDTTELEPREVNFELTEDESRYRGVVFLPAGKEYDVLRNVLKESGKEKGVQLVFPDESNHVRSEVTISEVAQSDVVIAEVSEPSPHISFNLGLSHAMGKPTILLAKGQPSGAFPLSGGIYLEYKGTNFGLERLHDVLGNVLEDVRRFPRRFRSSLPTLAETPFIDLDKLDPRELENLCFELFTQMGFQRVQWGKHFPEIDVVARLAKKDPDGFEYQELWLISMGLHAPMELLLEMAARDPAYLFHRLGMSSESEKFASVSGRATSSMTLLFIVLKDAIESDNFERRVRRIEKRLIDRQVPFPPFRIRVWDKQVLLTLLKQYPHLVYKYFSEEARTHSKYRKTPQELYDENVLLAEQLLKTQKELKEETDKRRRAERDAVWKDLSFTAAHKLGNPIFALETDLQGLRRRIAAESGDALSVAQQMSVSIEKAKVIIEQFKSLTKAQEVSPKPIDLAPLIVQSCRTASENGVNVICQEMGKIPKILGDPNRLAECFDELVTNAMHWFNKDVREINVVTDLPRQQDIPSGLDASRKFLKVTFSDNGKGVPLNEKKRIFDPFYTTHPHGTGIGLSLVQRIVEGHGGLIQEIGRPGEGASFEIYLPLAQ